MRAPAFWWDESPGGAARLLAPLGALYGAITASRMNRTGVQAPVPVICVGNFIAGGAGKTPVAIALGRLLQDLGARPAFVSRGYGGTHRGAPHRVATSDQSSLVGDEPLLLAQIAETFVSTDRVAGAQTAAQAGASVVVLDDGLQNGTLAKTLSVAVVDGRSGVGNGLCVPAGPLRAPLDAQWSSVDAVIVVGDGAAGGRIAQIARARGKPVFEAVLEPDADAAARLQGRKVFAFAGIGEPRKFRRSLRAVGAEIVGRRDFADHHAFSDGEMAGLRAEATALGAQLVTTEKDLVRISDARDIDTLPVMLRFADVEGVRDLVRKAIDM